MRGFNHARTFLLVVWFSTGIGPLLGGQGEPMGGGVIRESGRLEPCESTVVRSQAASARAILTVVPQGQMVTKGDLLVELDDLELREEKGLADVRVFEAQSQVEAAEMILPAREKESAMAVEIAQQALAIAERAAQMFETVEYPRLLARAESELRLAQERLAMASERRMQVEQRLANDQDKGPLQEAGLLVSEAQTRLQMAETELRTLGAFVHEQRQAELRLTIAQRRLDLERARNQRAEVTHRAKAEMAIAKVHLAHEQERALFLEEQIAACRIYAPRAGIVRYAESISERGPGRASVGPGTVIHCHEPLVHVASIEYPKLTVRTTIEMARRIERGRAATIRVDALPQQTFRGHVTDVRIPPSSAPGAVAGLITVQIDDPADALRPGMSARVEIEP